MASSATPTPLKGKKERELTNNERVALMGMMLGMSQNGKLPKGAFTRLSEKFRCGARTVSRLWDSSPQSRETGMVVMKEVLSKKSERGRKTGWDRQALKEAVKEVPVMNRQTLRDLEAEVDVPKTTLHRIMQDEGVLKRKKVYLKPKLSDHHKVWRMEYCLAHEDPQTPGFFTECLDRVHVDEKWFHMMTDGRCFILTKDEEDPYHHCQHKSYIGKVMFISAVARPRKLQNGEYWEGKIGIWPIG